jgi:hypothetical protein
MKMVYTHKKAEEIAKAASAVVTMYEMNERNQGTLNGRVVMGAALSAAQTTLMNAITPITTLIIMENDQGDYQPLLWCPDEGWAREYLEHAANMAFLEVWEVSREEPAPKRITSDFCERWMQDAARWHEDEDEYLSRLPLYVQEKFGDEALSRYRHGGAK